MPSSRFIGRFLATLLVVISAIGQFNAHAHYCRPAATTGNNVNKYGEHQKQVPSLQLLAERAPKQSNAREQRHKKPLISEVFQPVVAFTFIKRFRLVERVTDYSSTHILQRPAVVFSLRGPPGHSYANA
jgi:hypothetical protein